MILVCGNLVLVMKGASRDYWVQDCSAATENILLAATALGLGSLWVGLHPIESAYHPLCKILDLPAHVTPMSLVYIGYPAQEKEPRTSYGAKHVYWQKYDPNRKHRARRKSLKRL